LQRMVEVTRRAGAHLPFSPTTDYINTIPAHLEAKPSGDPGLEWRIRTLVRWSYRQLRQFGNAVRRWLQSCLARARRRPPRRPALYPRALIARCICTRVS
jgi:hypothetical protein